MRSLRLARVALAGAGCAGLLYASVQSVRFALADSYSRLETLEGARQAIRLTPEKGDYHARMSLLLAEEEPAAATGFFRRAVALNPADARSWIELGLRAEADGDYAAAERCLLRAAEEDRQYLPRWTLANYYFRRNDQRRFWMWAKSAASMVHGDARPLFRLCGAVTEDGALIERLDLRDPALRAAYLSYLIASGRPEWIAPAARTVLSGNREADTRLVLSACDRLIQMKAVDAAVEVWNALASGRRIPYAPLNPSMKRSLTNASFSGAPTSLAFDWRVPPLKGVSLAAAEGSSGLRVSFSGEQPASCEPLWQFIPVVENADYEFTFSYRTAGIEPDTGLGWRVADVAGSRVIAEPASLSSGGDAGGAVRFHTPPGCRLIRLGLAYRRALGTTRIRGAILLRNLALTYR